LILIQTSASWKKYLRISGKRLAFALKPRQNNPHPVVSFFRQLDEFGPSQRARAAAHPKAYMVAEHAQA
jgi:hypothetical protein